MQEQYEIAPVNVLRIITLFSRYVFIYENLENLADVTNLVKILKLLGKTNEDWTKCTI